MGLLRRMANLIGRSQVDRELDAEFEAHIALRTEDNIASGMTPQEARRDALVRFGNPVVMKERTAGADMALGIGGLWRDVRYALRQMRRSPGFALTAIITLALGIGANIVVFGVLNAIILDPLHVADPESLYQINHKEWMASAQSIPAYEDYKRRNTTFTDMAAVYGMSGVGLRWQNALHSISGYDVTGNYFDMLGVQPELGRFFHAADEHGPNSAPYIVLSDRLWHNVFNADPHILGAAVEVNKHPFTVIGIAPPEFQGTERFYWPDYWIPMVNEEQAEGWDFHHDRLVTPVSVLGRIRPGVTARQATDDLNRIAADLAREYPQTDQDQSARLVRPGLEGDESEMIYKFVFGIMALAGMVLLAACTNLASLFAARASDRTRELALRAALGSSRGRLLRQLLTESVLVALIGGAAGMGGAGLLLHFLNRYDPLYGGDGGETLPTITLDWKIFAVAAGLSLASGLLFGLIPARQAWSAQPIRSIKNTPVATSGLRRFAVRDLLLGAQIAICTLLVASSLVAVRSMQRLLAVPLGIDPKGVTLANQDLSMMGIDGNDALLKQKAMIDAAMQIPGVTAAGTVNFAPLAGGGMQGIPIYRPEAPDKHLGNEVLSTRIYPVSTGYFTAAGTRLLSGRSFTWADDATRKPFAAIVNQTFARKMFNGAPAVGQKFSMFGDLYIVVGVSEDGKYGGLRHANLGGESEPALYTSSAQMVRSFTSLVVRSHLPQNEIAATLQRTMSSIAPGLPVQISPWQYAVNNVMFPARTAAEALSIMGMLAAMLAITGIFGMAAYSVSKRMKELGIRVALGARRTQLLRSAVGRPLALLAIGSVLGILAALTATPLLSRIVVNANSRDPLVLIGVVVTMILLGGIATCIPARRALSVNPSTLMREE
ncbi:ABC transporter permease [Terracidiphilus gabretensis]|jgi:predicted permease|uniref:ABC transporter permease n=1 Tax=Terracidiphilus gabretensis TaxID=1577687 RepID=UPI00071B584B|nr:ABC transporter permease [Terracidiphilus gabretensis]